MELIQKTGLSFSHGQKLESSALNMMNDRINELVDVVNSLLKSGYNADIEGGTNFEDILNKVPENRRVRGIKIRFKGKEGYEEYIFLGGEWYEKENWQLIPCPKIIDGGEW